MKHYHFDNDSKYLTGIYKCNNVRNCNIINSEYIKHSTNAKVLQSGGELTVLQMNTKLLTNALPPNLRNR